MLSKNDKFRFYPEKLGEIYTHPDLGPCKVIILATHSETDEDMVVFQSTLFETYYVAKAFSFLEKLPEIEHKKNDSKECIQYPEPGCEYRHYKGGKYIVHFLAKDTITQEIYVVYKSILFGSNYVRPLTKWFDRIYKTNRTERFELIVK